MSTEPEARLLVVEDEPNIRELLATSLRFAGFEVDAAGRRRQRARLAAEREPDLVVLDVMLPDMDGFTVTRRLRDRASAADRLRHRARRDRRQDPGPDRRAATTTSPSRSASRRSSPASAPCCAARGARPTTAPTCASTTSSSTRTPTRCAAAAASSTLSPTEFKLLRYLMLNPNRVLSKAQILDHVWDYDFRGESGIVESYISYLRRKIDIDGPPLIHTKRGVGYVLRGRRRRSDALAVRRPASAERGRPPRPRRRQALPGLRRGDRRRCGSWPLPLGAPIAVLLVLLARRPTLTAADGYLMRRDRRSCVDHDLRPAANGAAARASRPSARAAFRRLRRRLLPTDGTEPAGSTHRRGRRSPAVPAAAARPTRASRGTPFTVGVDGRRQRGGPSPAAARTAPPPSSSPCRCERSSRTVRRLSWSSCSSASPSSPAAVHRLVCRAAHLPAAQPDRGHRGAIAAGDLTRRVPTPDHRRRGRLAVALAQRDARPDRAELRRARGHEEQMRRSSPTPRTSCARRWRPWAATPSSTARAPCRPPRTSPARWAASRARRPG